MTNFHKGLWLAICFSLLPVLLFGADEPKYPAATIADSLKQGASAVVRDYSEVFTQSDVNHATYKVTKVVTILNKLGDGFAHFAIYGDRFRELSDFSGIIRDASGNVIKKIKKGDLRFSSVSEGAGTDDNFSITYICSLPGYPCTVEYTYQEKWKNGIASYPVFAPQNRYSVSVEKSDLRIETPLNVEMRERNNFGGSLKKETVGDKNIYSISLNNLKAVLGEPLSPSIGEVLPVMMTAPADMCYDSFCGNMKDWNSYGLWIASLLKGRDQLSPDLAAKLQDMVKGAKTDKEKIGIIYDYLQKNTRYVSIQLGIGGYQPIDALTVSKMGFGDCKGLTNLMKAMLASVGIASNYCVIRLDEKDKDLYPDFPSFYQLNHVILMVPQKNDSIWLECTSQTLPFGYIHQDIAGHNAIVVSDKGGQLVRLPSYTDKQNRQESVMEVVISEEGSATGKVSFTQYLDGYESTVYSFRANDNERILKFINGNLKLPQVKIGKFVASEDRSDFPFTCVKADIEVPDFANRTGSRLFIPACPLAKTSFNILTASTRNQDIVLRTGFSESDTIIITIPQAYTLEALPKDLDVNTTFGSIKAKTTVDGDKIIYIQDVDIISGRYNRSQYTEVKDFFAQITAAVKRNIVLKKL